MKQILDWAIQSTQFKKWSGIVGGTALGMWLSMNYHVQIAATLAAWGVSKGEFGNALVAVMGASGVALSVGLSVAKTRLAAQQGTAQPTPTSSGMP